MGLAAFHFKGFLSQVSQHSQSSHTTPKFMGKRENEQKAFGPGPWGWYTLFEPHATSLLQAVVFSLLEESPGVRGLGTKSFRSVADFCQLIDVLLGSSRWSEEALCRPGRSQKIGKRHHCKLSVRHDKRALLGSQQGETTRSFERPGASAPSKKMLPALSMPSWGCH